MTLTNVGAGTFDVVRFMRFDPDNSKDIGAYDTIQTIDRAVLGGDSVSVVSARSKPDDAYATASGRQAGEHSLLHQRQPGAGELCRVEPAGAGRRDL